MFYLAQGLAYRVTHGLDLADGATDVPRRRPFGGLRGALGRRASRAPR